MSHQSVVPTLRNFKSQAAHFSEPTLWARSTQNETSKNYEKHHAGGRYLFCRNNKSSIRILNNCLQIQNM